MIKIVFGMENFSKLHHPVLFIISNVDNDISSFFQSEFRHWTEDLRDLTLGLTGNVSCGFMKLYIAFSIDTCYLLVHPDLQMKKSKILHIIVHKTKV